jgi:hypothetical protein
MHFLPDRPISRARAASCVLVNLAATPGLGSLMAGRWIAGLGQLVVAVAGFLMVVVWFFKVMIQYYGQVTGNVAAHPVGWIGVTGAILFAASWLWALVTSVSLLREAKADEPVQPKPAPPQLTDLPGGPPKLS